MNNVKPLPDINQYNKEFFDAAKENKLLLQFCKRCQEYIFYPRHVCPKCLNNNVVWKSASGEGELYSFAEVHRPQHKGLYSEVPIFLAAVKLKEGPIMISRVVDCPKSEIQIGMKLKVKGHPINDEVSVPVFCPK